MKLNYRNNLLTISNCEFPDTNTIFNNFSISKKKRYEYYQRKRIRINDNYISQNHSLTNKDIIYIQLIDEEDQIEPWFEDISILYEDELFCIVSKPSGMLVHSDGNETKHTLYNLVKAHYILHGNNTCVRAIHRLDYETSGAVIFCKIPFFLPMSDTLLKNKEIYREYDALVQGKWTVKSMTITEGIARDRHDARKMRISKQGKYAKTDVKLKKQYSNYSWVHCQLYTGRTHQIRVHLASRQHAILSDPLYGEKSPLISRLALHASTVHIPHPLTNTILEVRCPFYPDMRKLIK